MKKQVKLNEDIKEEAHCVVHTYVPPPVITAFQRIKKANALTGILSNKEFVKLVSSLEEGEYLLDIFAQAVESSLESMYANDKQTREKVSNLAGQIDVAYAKMQAMSASPIQAVLDRLLQNLGSAPVSQPAPVQDYFANQPVRGQGIMDF
jgi:uncharacterized protein with beta-barrel porin domain